MKRVKITKNLEGYCSSPLDEHSILLIGNGFKARKQKIINTCLILVSALLIGIILSVLANMFCHDFIGIMSVILLVVLYIPFLLCSIECCDINRFSSVKVFGYEMITSKDDMNEVESPDIKLLSSPLARSLVSEINSQGRKMLNFEKMIISRLSEV